MSPRQKITAGGWRQVTRRVLSCWRGIGYCAIAATTTTEPGMAKWISLLWAAALALLIALLGGGIGDGIWRIRLRLTRLHGFVCDIVLQPGRAEEGEEEVEPP